MRRRLLILVAVFLLAGAVVNVAVAWGCAQYLAPGVRLHSVRFNWGERSTATQHLFPPNTENQAEETEEGWTLGITVKRIRQATFTLPEEPSPIDNILETTRIGFPLKAIQVQRLRVGGRETRRGADVLGVGLTANTLFYAVILWLLICWLLAVRRKWRVQRGLCPACAYPRGEADVCSECGKPLPGRAKVAT